MTQSFCHNCGNALQPSWLACVSCGQPTFDKKPTKCPNCTLIINHESPNYCPYCLYSISNKAEVVSKTVTMPIKQIPSRQSTEIIVNEKQQVSKGLITQFLRFNGDGSKGLIQSNGFTYRAYQLLILSSLFSSLVLIGINILFSTETDASIREVLESYILWANGFFMVFIGFCIGYTFVMSRIKKLLGYNMVARYTSGIAISFIIKDVFVLFLAVYVFVFEGKGGYGLAMVGFWVMTSIFLIYFVLHAMVLTKQLYGTGVLLSFFIISFIFGVAYVLTFYSTMLLTLVIHIIR